jgi:methionine-rich copper-binding protein CopC
LQPKACPDIQPYGQNAMDRREFIAMVGGVAAVTSTSPAFAQRGGAFLDRAVPGVGLTVSGPVRELRLNFTMDVVGAFSDVQVTSSTGAAIPASRPVYDPSSQQVVIIKFRGALPPGTYKVRWHMVSAYGRSTWGTFHFTVTLAPAWSVPPARGRLERDGRRWQWWGRGSGRAGGLQREGE